MGCEYNIDWGSVPAWIGLILSAIGSGFLIANYIGERRKRKLALRPFFTLAETIIDIQWRSKIKLKNIGEIAIIRSIKNEEADVVVTKLGYSKGDIIDITISIIHNKEKYSPKYKIEIIFEDIEGRLYKQTFLTHKGNNHNIETPPLEISDKI